jgi:hypothetical protein
MSKKHSELLQIFNNTEADTDRIWKIAKEIWQGISSSMIARSFLLAYRIMRKIIETKGDTDWLKNGAPHCNVRRDFYDTDRDVKKISDAVDVEENETAASQCYQPSFIVATFPAITLYLKPAISTLIAREAHNLGIFMSVRPSICLFDFCRLFSIPF